MTPEIENIIEQLKSLKEKFQKNQDSIESDLDNLWMKMANSNPLHFRACMDKIKSLQRNYDFNKDLKALTKGIDEAISLIRLH